MSRANELGQIRPRLVRYATRRLRDRHQAEDAVQDALVAALEGMERFAGASSLGTWVSGILKHKIADRARAAVREEPLAEELELAESDPQEQYARQRFFQVVDAALRRLPENSAHVFVLREVMGLEPREVCERLAISLPNCWVSLHRAKARLRALVPDEV